MESEPESAIGTGYRIFAVPRHSIAYGARSASQCALTDAFRSLRYVYGAAKRGR